ncbi:hypothetical protein DFAR_3230002 [Desulfarculales bacterium]
MGTSPGMAVVDNIVKANAVWVGPATGSPHWLQPLKKNVFGVYPLYLDESSIFTNYTLFILKKAKLGYIYQNDDYGNAGLEGSQVEMKSHGRKLVLEIPVEVTDTELVSHVLNLKEARAEAVIMWVLSEHAAILMGSSAKLGYKPQWVAAATLSDALLMYNLTRACGRGSSLATLPSCPTPSIP